MAGGGRRSGGRTGSEPACALLLLMPGDEPSNAASLEATGLATEQVAVDAGLEAVLGGGQSIEAEAQEAFAISASQTGGECSSEAG